MGRRRERGRPRPLPPEPFTASRWACRAKCPMSCWRGFWHPSGVRVVWGGDGVRWCRFAQPPATSWQPSGLLRPPHGVPASAGGGVALSNAHEVSTRWVVADATPPEGGTPSLAPPADRSLGDSEIESAACPHAPPGAPGALPGARPSPAASPRAFLGISQGLSGEVADVVVARVLAPLRGAGSCVGAVSGGIASLNHRHHSGNPPGCFGPRMESRLQPGEASPRRTRRKFPRDGCLRAPRRLKAGLHASLHRRTAAWVIPRLSPPRAHTPRWEHRERCRERGRPRPHPPEPFSASRRACRAKCTMAWWRGFWHPSGVRGFVGWGRCPVVSLRSTTGYILATLRVAPGSWPVRRMESLPAARSSPLAVKSGGLSARRWRIIRG